MTPYYDEAGITLYLGDCRDITEWLSADVLVTDPPYGMKLRSSRNGAFGANEVAGDDDASVRDDALTLWRRPRAKGQVWGRNRPALVFGRWSVPRPDGTRMVLTWEKGEHVGMGDLALPWKPNTEEVYVMGSGFHGTRTTSVLRHLAIAGTVGQAARGTRHHPTEKPVGLMRELLAKCPPGVVADPFAGLAPLIVSMLPPHRVYVEPFFGSGAVLFAKRPSTHEIVNDLDHNVVTFFRVLRERPAELEVACRLTPYARVEHQAADLDEDLDDLERARRFWVRVNQSFGKSLGRTGFSVTCARTQSAPGSTWSRISRFAGVAERLQQVTIESCDAAGLVERMATADDTAVYADPPYLAETRRGYVNGGARASDYRCDMGAPEDHERLAEALKATPAAVLLSGYHSPLYDRLYADWERVEIAVHVHSSNALTNSRGERTEVIWTNRPIESGQLDFGMPA